MKLDKNNPKKYRHINGTKVIAIHELKKKDNDFIYLIETEHYNPLFWKETDTFIQEIPKERWQGLYLDKNGELNFWNSHAANTHPIFDSFEELPIRYQAGFNLDTLEVRKK